MMFVMLKVFCQWVNAEGFMALARQFSRILHESLLFGWLRTAANSSRAP
jgi:hypothetical protein